VRGKSPTDATLPQPLPRREGGDGNASHAAMIRPRGPLRYLRLLWLFARVSVQNDAAYRFDFFLRVVIAILQLGGELIGLWVIFANTPALAGWNVYQVLVLLGVFRVMVGIIAMIIAPNMRLIMDNIREGTLDFVLIKPLNSQFYASFRQVVVWRVTDIILGIALAVIGSVALARAISVGQILLFIAMLAAGAVIIYSFWLILTTLVFWATRIENIEMVFWNVFEAGRYPIDIYRPWVRWGLTFILPLAFLTTFPAGTLVGRTGPGALLAALVVAPVMLTLATLFWRFGLRHYRGASA
jgi:ABC-2 type transport system permease protein